MSRCRFSLSRYTWIPDACSSLQSGNQKTHDTSHETPRLEEYESYVRGIWQRQWLTNNGPLVNELELQLKQYLNVPHMIYVSNGTSALQIAIKVLGLQGEIITTPFSFIATTR